MNTAVIGQLCSTTKISGSVTYGFVVSESAVLSGAAEPYLAFMSAGKSLSVDRKRSGMCEPSAIFAAQGRYPFRTRYRHLSDNRIVDLRAANRA